MDDRLSRRRLLALGGYGMLATTLPWLSGCGGGGGAKPAGAGGTGFEGGGVPAEGAPGTAVTPAQRLAALGAIAAAITPAAGAGPRFDGVALANALRAMTVFQRVGISTARQNVWATFTDGRSLAVPNNLVPSGPGAPLAVGAAPVAAGRARAAGSRGAAAAATQDLLPALLTLDQYRQLDMLGAVPASGAVDAAHLARDFVDQDTLPNLRRMAVGRGFVLPAIQQGSPLDAGIDNGVEGLRDLSGDGVFFINATSAEVVAGGTPVNVICVDTPASEENLLRHEAELADGTLAYAVTMRGVAGAWVPYACLAITPAFAASWTFPVQSLAILNLTGGSVLQDWGGVLSGAGLRNVFTWDRPVSWQRMLAFADDLLQLLLATNNLDGTIVTQAIEPRLRCYGVGETLTYLSGRHLTDDADGVNQAAYLQAQSAPLLVNTLLPTIDYVSIDEATSVIELTGQFGAPGGVDALARHSASPPARFDEPLLARAADGPLPGADALTSPLWHGDLIQSRPEPNALLRGGYLQVQNRGRCSNAVQITHWLIPAHVVTTITGGLTLDVTVNLHLRADVRGHRMAPDGARSNNRPQLALATTLESWAQYVASGEIARTVDGVTTTVTWSGGGVVSNTPELMRVFASGPLGWLDRRMTFTLGVLDGPPYDERTVVKRGLETLSDDTAAKPVMVTAVLATSGGMLELAFGDDWGVLPGSVELLSESVNLLGPRTRSTVLTWPAVTPDFPPEATVGGV